jgi:hypothetical protein
VTELLRGSEMTRCARTGREQPQQNLRLLDHLVSAGKQPRRQLQSERLRGDPVHDEIELVGCSTGATLPPAAEPANIVTAGPKAFV